MNTNETTYKDIKWGGGGSINNNQRNGKILRYKIIKIVYDPADKIINW